MAFNNAPLLPHSERRPSAPLLWAWIGCGAMLTAGMWWAFASTTATSNAHIRVQPTVGVQTGIVAPHQRSNRVMVPPAEARTIATSTTTLAAAPVAAAAASSGLAGPWLPLLAIFISAVAIVINFFRRSENTLVPVPAYYAPALPPSQEELLAKRRSNRMDEVAQAVEAERASRKNLSPRQVVLELQRGNARFWSGTPERPELNAMERRALIIGQTPTVAILSCADSRVPVEIVFDQGLGSIFVVRVAGNILDSTALGSIEFSVKYLGVKVLLVMGHEGCGAVKGAVAMSNADLDAQPAYLQTVLRNIKSNLNLSALSKIRDSRAQDREAIVTNCSSQVKRLQENKLIAERVADGSLLVCGAFYEITSGIVDFFTLDKNGLVVDV